jgi:hypothetical protein
MRYLEDHSFGGTQPLSGNITPRTQGNVTPTRSCITPKSKERIRDMILNTDEHNKVVYYEDQPQKDPPPSILKNKICPRNPWFPDKSLTGYENLKESIYSNPRKLATIMNYTCQKVLEGNLYLKKKNPSLDWNKSIQGSDFYSRSDKWQVQKERKIEYLKYLLAHKEVEGCTFRPDTNSTSPKKRHKM